MRRARAAAAALAGFMAACAGPRPCTRALCPLSVGASYRVSGWSAPVTVGSGTPALPIVPDASVEILAGPAEFLNGRSTVRAETGAAFLFFVSTGSSKTPAIAVSSGAVTVTADAASRAVAPGATCLLPAAP